MAKSRVNIIPSSWGEYPFEVRKQFEIFEAANIFLNSVPIETTDVLLSYFIFFFLFFKKIFHFKYNNKFFNSRKILFFF